MRGQRGVALAIVLWFLAGMSLLVSGITYLARIDTQMAQLHLARATAVSAGDGAILLMLAGFAGSNAPPRLRERPLAGEFLVGSQAVTVAMVPAAGLVDLNTAPAAVLAGLFTRAAHIPDPDAKTLADNLVLWRTRAGSYPPAGGGRVLAPEDLLQVPGVTRTLLDAVRDYVVVASGTAGVAPDPAVTADTVTAAFNTADAVTADAPDAPAGSDGAVGRFWRVDATISTGGRTWLRRKWAILGGDDGGPLPWRFARVEAPRIVGGERVGH